MRLVLISDTHGMLPSHLPQGELLIHCGDLTRYGSRSEVMDLAKNLKELWLCSGNIRPSPRILMIPGNHDFGIEKYPEEMRRKLSNLGITLMINDGDVIDNMVFFGMAYTPKFGNWAFMKPEQELKELWSLVPRSTDVLISHGPPHERLDKTYFGEHVGSTSHALEVQYRIRPTLNCFGHIHEAYGARRDEFEVFGTHYAIDYINCSLTNHQYELVNQPVVYDLEV